MKDPDEKLIEGWTGRRGSGCGVLIIALVLAGITLAFACSVRGEEVRLQWDPNPEPDIAGYELEVTGDSVKSVLTVDPAATVDLHTGTYTFAVRAVGMDGRESPLSESIIHTVPSNTWPRVTVSSEAPQFPASSLIDGQPLPIFATRYDVPQTDPQWIEIDVGEPRWIGGLKYLPRQDQWDSGHLTNYQLIVDSSVVASGGFTALDKAEKAILFKPMLARRVRLLSGLTHLTASEITLIERMPPMPLSEMRVITRHSKDLSDWAVLSESTVPMGAKGFFQLQFTDLSGRPIKVTYQVETTP